MPHEPKVQDGGLKGGYPLVSEYKYLGILFDDQLSFKRELKVKRSFERKMRMKSWILHSNKLHGRCRL